ncbi:MULTISPECIES: transporter substrate-binding domain-containing protein [unclassified Geodermatophilus]|uniref:transporter substrate-binding domain-containing protein n=1 Tax=unclassified Geodermatophilus TaxID=2637632 RepID=UPI003EEA15F3
MTENEDIAALVPEEVAGTGTLRVASEVYPPAVIVPPSGGDPTGWEIAIAKDVATLMGLEAEITIVPFDGLIPSLQANRFDVAMGEIAVLPERTAVLTFVSDHESGDSFLVNADSDIEEIAAPEDLCGHSAAALLGSVELTRMQEYAANCAANGLPELSVDSYKDQAAVNLALQGQKVDMSIGSTSQLAYVDQQASGQFRLIDAPFIETIPTGIPIADTPYEAEMAEAVRAAVQELIDSGRMQEILDEFNAGKGNVETAEVVTS